MQPSPAQLARFQAVTARPGPFLAPKLAGPAEPFHRNRFTTKAELAADQAANPPYGSNHAGETFTRLHQTSGTSTGVPLRWRDTAEGWAWVVGCWRTYFGWMGLTAADRAAFPFSFGPFIAFWSAYEAATAEGLGVLPGGGMSTVARLRWLLDHGATVVFATPTYALHLAETAAAEGFDLPGSSVRAVVVAGEPGGSIPATRERISAGWGARTFDHYGLTEVGPVASERADTPGTLVVNEAEFIAEVIDPVDGVGELVLTNLGRVGSPVVRYRTGDLVRAERRPDGLHLVGGILGRADDMLHVRGNNVYPSAVEAIVRRFPWVGEFRLIAAQAGHLTDLRLEVEPTPAAPADACEQLARAVKDGLLFRMPVTTVPPGTLPRPELKARRLVRV